MKRVLGTAAAAAVIAFLPLSGAAEDAPAPPLVKFAVVSDGIPAPLTTQPGDPVAGRKVVEDRKLGNCLSCHAFPLDAPDQGNVGPDLHGVGARLTRAELRLRVVNMKLIDPQTIMPAYYRVDGLHDVGTAFAGRTILTAQQIEDLVAFLATINSTGAPR